MAELKVSLVVRLRKISFKTYGGMIYEREYPDTSSGKDESRMQLHSVNIPFPDGSSLTAEFLWGLQ